MMDWRPIKTAPRDGKPIWGWLYDGGIHLIRWCSAEESAEKAGGMPDEYISCWVKCAAEEDGDWAPPAWLPFDAIKVPDGVVWVHDLNKWRDTPQK